MRFRFDPLSRAFSSRRVFDESAECISVDGRAKRIKMYAFSNENALVWTSLVACVACVVTGYEHLNLDGAFRSVFYYSLVITVVLMKAVQKWRHRPTIPYTTYEDHFRHRADFVSEARKRLFLQIVSKTLT